MNTERKQQLKDAVELLEKARGIVSAAQEGEQEDFDEEEDESKRDEQLSENADALENAGDAIGEVIAALNDL